MAGSLQVGLAYVVSDFRFRAVVLPAAVRSVFLPKTSATNKSGRAVARAALARRCQLIDR